jgi:hypothetical protein
MTTVWIYIDTKYHVGHPDHQWAGGQSLAPILDCQVWCMPFPGLRKVDGESGFGRLEVRADRSKQPGRPTLKRVGCERIARRVTDNQEFPC